MSALQRRASHDRAPAAGSPAGASPGFGSAGELSDENSLAKAQLTDERLAVEGVSGSGESLPYLAAIQKAFGPYSVADVKAHRGAEAKEASARLGANAYATGNDVALGAGDDLHTVAHEAAHVVQQQAGVHAEGRTGEEGDALEQHADRVADAVVAGRDASGILGEVAGPPGGGRATTGLQKDGNTADAGAGLDATALQQALNSASVNLDAIAADYRATVPGVVTRANGAGSRMTGALSTSIGRLNTFVNGENAAMLTSFQASYLDVFRDATLSTLVGLVPPPWGPMLGFAYSMGVGSWLAHRQNGQVEESLANNRWLGQQQGLVTDDLIQRIMGESQSLFRGFGGVEGRLAEMCDGEQGTLSVIKRQITHEQGQLNTMILGGETPNARDIEDASNTYGEAVRFSDRYDRQKSGLSAVVTQLETAATSTVTDAKNAVDHVVALYVKHRTGDSGITVSGYANHAFSGPVFYIHLYQPSLGFTASAETLNVLAGMSFNDFAREQIPITASITVPAPRAQQDFDLRQTATGQRSPTSTGDNAALSYLINWAGSESMTPSAKSQLALDMMWGSLQNAPLSAQRSR